jgi:transposase InsO family protein
MSGQHQTRALCEVMETSASGYYAWQQRQGCPSRREASNRLLLANIHKSFKDSGRTYGSPRITRELRQNGALVGHNRVARLMRLEALQGRQKQRFRIRTTDSRHDQPIAPNLLAGQTSPAKPDQVWVSDITYVDTEQGWLYVAGVMDRCTRRVVGWSMSESLDATLPLKALQMALNRRRPSAGLLHHSDRGVQYASALYRQVLSKYGLIASMSRKANCYDNAAMESFWSTLKMELVYRGNFVTRDQARLAIFNYIEGFYNRRRLHSSLGFKSPLDYESSLN